MKELYRDGILILREKEKINLFTNSKILKQTNLKIRNAPIPKFLTVVEYTSSTSFSVIKFFIFD